MNFETDTSSKLPTPHIQDSSVNSPIFSVNWIHTIWKIIKMYLCTAVICNVRNGNMIIKLVMDISSASYFSVVYTGLFKMIVGVQLSSENSAPNSGNNHHLTIPFEGGMQSFKRQGACVSRNWRYEPEPPLKPSPLTCYKQSGTNSIIVLMFVESQRVHI